MKFEEFWNKVSKLPREQVFTDSDLRTNIGFGIRDISDEGIWLHNFAEENKSNYKDELIDKQKFHQMWSSKMSTKLEYTGEDCTSLYQSGETPAEYYIFKILIEKIRPNRID